MSLPVPEGLELDGLEDPFQSKILWDSINLGSEAIPVLSVMCCCGKVLDYEQVNLMAPLTGVKELSGF